MDGTDKTVKELRNEAKKLNIEGYSTMNRGELCTALNYKPCGKRVQKKPVKKSPKPKKKSPQKPTAWKGVYSEKSTREELKQLCKERNLNVGGNKREMVKRLRDAEEEEKNRKKNEFERKQLLHDEEFVDTFPELINTLEHLQKEVEKTFQPKTVNKEKWNFLQMQSDMLEMEMKRFIKSLKEYNAQNIDEFEDEIL